MKISPELKGSDWPDVKGAQLTATAAADSGEFIGVCVVGVAGPISRGPVAARAEISDRYSS